MSSIFMTLDKVLSWEVIKTSQGMVKTIKVKKSMLSLHKSTLQVRRRCLIDLICMKGRRSIKSKKSFQA